MDLYTHTSDSFEVGKYQNSRMLSFTKTKYRLLNTFIYTSSDYKYMLFAMMVNHKTQNMNEILQLYKMLRKGVIAFPISVWNTLKINSKKINEDVLYEYIRFISKYNMLKDQNTCK